jgi:uncharacterized membrane protein (Fun14 family)
MVSDALIQAGLSGGVGIGGGIAIGWFIKKILKILLFVVGAFFVALLAMEARGWISVKWAAITDQLNTLVSNSTATSALFNMHSGEQILTTLGIPLTGGLALGFAIGFMRG